MHRIYVEDGTCWTLASRYLGPLPTDAKKLTVYVTQFAPYAEEVCLVADDGRRLCDIGPQHEHVDGN